MDLGKALDLLKSKKMPIGTVHNGMKKVAEGKWEPVKEGASKKPEDRADENTSSHHEDEAGRHMSEATKHNDIASRLDAKIKERKKVDPNYEVPEAAQKVLDESKAKAKGHTEDYHAKKKTSDDAKSDVEATKQEESVKESKKNQSEKNKNQKLEESAQKKVDDLQAKKDKATKDRKDAEKKITESKKKIKDLNDKLKRFKTDTSQVRPSTDKEEAQAKKDKAAKQKQLDDEWSDSEAPGQNNGTGEHSVDWSTVDSHNRRSKEYKAAIADYKDLTDDELKEIATKIGMQMDKEKGPGARGSYEVGARFYPWKGVGKKHALDLIATYNMGGQEIKKGKMQIAMQDHERREQYQADKMKEGAIADPRPSVEKADKKSKLKKSLIQADEQGSAINTADFMRDLNEALKCPYFNIFNETMQGYNYGDAPRTIQLDKGYSIIMSKVDDGLYSGFVRQTVDWDGDSPLEETASKVEKQTIPSIISFLKAKEYIQPPQAIVDEPMSDIEPPQAFEASEDESFEAPVQVQEVMADQAQEEIIVEAMQDESDKALALKLINLLDRLI